MFAVFEKFVCFGKELEQLSRAIPELVAEDIGPDQQQNTKRAQLYRYRPYQNSPASCGECFGQPTATGRYDMEIIKRKLIVIFFMIPF